MADEKLEDLPAASDTTEAIFYGVQGGVDKQFSDALINPSAPVDSVNSATGAVVLDADDISDTSTTNKFVQDEWLTNTVVASAVNNVNITNSITGDRPTVSAVGTDTDIDLCLSPKGEGEIVIITGTRILHTSTHTDDHALEIDINADGFGDVKAIDIDYITGALEATEDESVIFVQVDESSSTGGEVHALEVLSTSTGAAAVHGMEVGVNVGAIEQFSGVFVDTDTVLVLAVDHTAALSDGGAGNITFFDADNDTVTIGDAALFGELEFILDTSSSKNIQPVYEYSTGVGTWATFTPTDGTNGFLNTGAVLWNDGDLAGWVVGTGSEYLVRITRTRNGNITSPIVDLVQVAATTEFYWDKSGNLKINDLEVTGTLTAPVSYPEFAMFTVTDNTSVNSTSFVNHTLVATAITDDEFSVVSGKVRVVTGGTYEIYGEIAVDEATTSNLRYKGETAFGINTTVPTIDTGVISGYIRQTGGNIEDSLICDEVLVLTAGQDIAAYVRRASSTTGVPLTRSAGTRIKIRKVK